MYGDIHPFNDIHVCQSSARDISKANYQDSEINCIKHILLTPLYIYIIKHMVAFGPNSP